MQNEQASESGSTAQIVRSLFTQTSTEVSGLIVRDKISNKSNIKLNALSISFSS